jgi:hypothetical protein
LCKAKRNGGNRVKEALGERVLAGIVGELVEDLGQEGKKNRSSGKKEDHNHGDDLRDLLQVLPDLRALIPGRFLPETFSLPVLQKGVQYNW